MRCLSCNKILTEEEDARTYDCSDERICLCSDCFDDAGIYDYDEEFYDDY